MLFDETTLHGAYIVRLDPLCDNRGFFARSFCKNEFFDHGLQSDIRQCNISFNRAKGTLRGLHYQAPPKSEAKLVYCTQGSIYDVIVDLRPFSPTYCKWEAVELSADNRRAIYIPENFAHGFQTLEDNSELLYLMFEFYSPELSRGVRWDDPALDITWPLLDPIMSDRDKSYPRYHKEMK